jgi:hypothetical protein
MKKSNIPYVISALKKKGEKWDELKEWLNLFKDVPLTTYIHVLEKMKELEEK